MLPHHQVFGDYLLLLCFIQVLLCWSTVSCSPSSTSSPSAPTTIMTCNELILLSTTASAATTTTSPQARMVQINVTEGTTWTLEPGCRYSYYDEQKAETSFSGANYFPLHLSLNIMATKKNNTLTAMATSVLNFTEVYLSGISISLTAAIVPTAAVEIDTTDSNDPVMMLSNAHLIISNSHVTVVALRKDTLYMNPFSVEMDNRIVSNFSLEVINSTLSAVCHSDGKVVTAAYQPQAACYGHILAASIIAKKVFNISIVVMNSSISAKGAGVVAAGGIMLQRKPIPVTPTTPLSLLSVSASGVSFIAVNSSLQAITGSAAGLQVAFAAVLSLVLDLDSLFVNHSSFMVVLKHCHVLTLVGTPVYAVTAVGGIAASRSYLYLSNLTLFFYSVNSQIETTARGSSSSFYGTGVSAILGIALGDYGLIKITDASLFTGSLNSSMKAVSSGFSGRDHALATAAILGFSVADMGGSASRINISRSFWIAHAEESMFTTDVRASTQVIWASVSSAVLGVAAGATCCGLAVFDYIDTATSTLTLIASNSRCSSIADAKGSSESASAAAVCVGLGISQPAQAAPPRISVGDVSIVTTNTDITVEITQPTLAALPSARSVAVGVGIAAKGRYQQHLDQTPNTSIQLYQCESNVDVKDSFCSVALSTSPIVFAELVALSGSLLSSGVCLSSRMVPVDVYERSLRATSDDDGGIRTSVGSSSADDRINALLTNTTSTNPYLFLKKHLQQALSSSSQTTISSRTIGPTVRDLSRISCTTGRSYSLPNPFASFNTTTLMDLATTAALCKEYLCPVWSNIPSNVVDRYRLIGLERNQSGPYWNYTSRTTGDSTSSNGGSSRTGSTTATSNDCRAAFKVPVITVGAPWFIAAAISSRLRQHSHQRWVSILFGDEEEQQRKQQQQKTHTLSSSSTGTEGLGGMDSQSAALSATAPLTTAFSRSEVTTVFRSSTSASLLMSSTSMIMIRSSSSLQHTTKSPTVSSRFFNGTVINNNSSNTTGNNHSGEKEPPKIKPSSPLALLLKIPQPTATAATRATIVSTVVAGGFFASFASSLIGSPSAAASMMSMNKAANAGRLMSVVVCRGFDAAEEEWPDDLNFLFMVFPLGPGGSTTDSDVDASGVVGYRFARATGAVTCVFLLFIGIVALMVGLVGVNIRSNNGDCHCRGCVCSWIVVDSNNHHREEEKGDDNADVGEEVEGDHKSNADDEVADKSRHLTPAASSPSSLRLVRCLLQFTQSLLLVWLAFLGPSAMEVAMTMLVHYGAEEKGTASSGATSSGGWIITAITLGVVPTLLLVGFLAWWLYKAFDGHNVAAQILRANNDDAAVVVTKEEERTQAALHLLLSVLWDSARGITTNTSTAAVSTTTGMTTAATSKKSLPSSSSLSSSWLASTLLASRFLVVEEILFSNLIAVVVGIQPSTHTGCLSVGITIVFLTLLHCLYVLLIRPYKAAFDMRAAVVLSILQLLLGVAVVLAQITTNGSQEQEWALMVVAVAQLLVNVGAFGVVFAAGCLGLKEQYCEKKKKEKETRATTEKDDLYQPLLLVPTTTPTTTTNITTSPGGGVGTPWTMASNKPNKKTKQGEETADDNRNQHTHNPLNQVV